MKPFCAGHLTPVLAALTLPWLLASCASETVPPPPPPLPKIELPLQIALQLHLIGIREPLPSLVGSAPASSSPVSVVPEPPTEGAQLRTSPNPEPRPSLVASAPPSPTPVSVVPEPRTPNPDPRSLPIRGFRLDSLRIVPTDQPVTLTGLELSRADFTAWLNALAASGNASLYLSPLFTVWPGRNASVHNLQELRYVANWRSEPQALNAEHRTMQRGFRMTAFPTALPGWKDLIVQFRLDFLSGDAPAATVCESIHAGNPPLAVDLLSLGTHSVSTTTPVRNGWSVVVAHMYRILAGPAPSVEHLICVVSLERVGKEPPVERNLIPSVPPRRYNLALYWEPAPATVSADQPPSENPSLIFDPAPSLPPFQSTVLSVLVASGQSAALEWSETVGRVAGITGGSPVVRRLNVAESWSGASAEIAPVASDDGRHLTARVRARLATRPENAALTQLLPTLRVPGKTDLMEKFRFTLARQITTRVDAPLMMSAAAEQTIPVVWSPFSDDPSRFPPPAVRPQKLVLLAMEVPMLVTPTGPDPQEEKPK